MSEKRGKRGRPRKTRMEVVKAEMTTRNLESDQWRIRQEWRLVSGRRRQLLKKKPNRDVDTVAYRGGVWGLQHSLPPNFRSFGKVEPDCKLSGKCLVFLFQHPD